MYVIKSTSDLLLRLFKSSLHLAVSICGCQWCIRVHIPLGRGRWCVCTCACVYGNQRSASPQVFLASLQLSLCFWSGVSHWPWAPCVSWAGRPARALRDHVCSTVGSQTCAQCRAFHMGSGHLSSGPQTSRQSHHLSHTWFGVLFLSFLKGGGVDTKVLCWKHLI